MKIWILFSALAITSCGKPYNSSYSDPLRYGYSVTGTTQFLQAREVMVNRCFICHASWAPNDQAAFVAAGLVTGSNVAASELYLHIRGNDSGEIGNMPPTETLSIEEINKIKNWINSF